MFKTAKADLLRGGNETGVGSVMGYYSRRAGLPSAHSTDKDAFTARKWGGGEGWTITRGNSGEGGAATEGRKGRGGRGRARGGPGGGPGEGGLG